MPITIVLPEPVAILLHNRSHAPPSPATSMPCLYESGASTHQISVSMASIWQK